MKSTRLKAIISLGVAASLSVLSCFPASADSYYTSLITKYSYYTKISYQFRERLEIYSHGAFATTYLETTTGVPMLKKTVSLMSLLMDPNNNIISSSGDTRLSVTSPSYSLYTSSTSTNYYHARGYVSLANAYYDGEYTYTVYSTGNTSSAYYSQSNTSSLLEPFTGYETTANGETYGLATEADICGEFPELIAAKGVNDVSGYIREEDMCADPDISIEKWNGTVIPVYDLSGNVIDTFVISAHEGTPEEAESDLI